MRTLSIISVSALMSACVMGCARHAEQQDRLAFHISGRIEAEACDTAFLKLIKEDGYEFVDSARVDSAGCFQLTGAISHPDFYILHFSNQGQQIMLVPDTCQNIEIASSAPNYTDVYSVSGSPESEKIAALVSRIYETRMISDSLGKIFRANLNSPNLAGIKTRLDSVLGQTTRLQREFSEKFISDNPASLVQIVCLSQYIAPKNPVFDPDRDYMIYKKVSDTLVAQYPENHHVKKLASYVDKLRQTHADGGTVIRQVKPGDTAPDITLRNSRGENVPLSQYKGKYILLDFWASWSDVARLNSENLQKIYWKYYNSGNFVVYQVAIESNSERWKQALKDQKIPWQSVSDVRLWESQAVQDYGVRALPGSFLIYPDFTVHEVNLAPDKLDNLLEDLIGKPSKTKKQ